MVVGRAFRKGAHQAVTSRSSGQLSLSMTRLWYRAALNGLSSPWGDGVRAVQGDSGQVDQLVTRL
jgi:hypothetical protein